MYVWGVADDVINYTQTLHNWYMIGRWCCQDISVSCNPSGWIYIPEIRAHAFETYSKDPRHL